ncbi:hypothetical protein H0X32_03785 [Patescibacteria group bacterium]|nr:hypothetical protein [Patescibacteria group bacterium]
MSMLRKFGAVALSSLLIFVAFPYVSFADTATDLAAAKVAQAAADKAAAISGNYIDFSGTELQTTGNTAVQASAAWNIVAKDYATAALADKQNGNSNVQLQIDLAGLNNASDEIHANANVVGGLQTISALSPTTTSILDKDYGTIQSNISSVETLKQNVNTATGNTTGAAQNASSSAAAAQNASALNAAAQKDQCDGSGALTNFGNCILPSIAFFIFQVSATILGFAALVFNWIVTITIFQFATYFANSPGFLLAWGILRDVGNIMLLFGFIFMGISTILDIQSFSAKKTLPGLIIFAVLLNFSLFASEGVVDVANALASSFFLQAGQSNEGGSCANQIGGSPTSVQTNVAGCTGTTAGISGTIIQAAGINTVFAAKTPLDKSSGALVLFLLSIFLIITAVVLFAGTILLIVRVLVLVFMLVVSPLGFAAMALPPFHKMAMGWWRKLLSEAFVAPVFLLLIFVSIKIMSSISVNSTGETASFADAVANPGSKDIGIFLIFFLITGFMIAALIAAKKMGASGAEFAANKASSLVFGTITRGTNFAVGGTSRLGRAAIQRSPLRNTAVARFAVNHVLRPLEGANLDVRRIPGASRAFGIAGITAGAKPARNATYTDISRIPQEMRAMSDARATEYKSEIRKQKLLRESRSEESLDDTTRRTLQQMSVKELEALRGIKEGVEVLARELTQEQFDRLQGSDGLTDDQKRRLRNARDTRFDGTGVTVPPPAGSPPGTPSLNMTRAARTLRSMRPDQVAALSPRTLTQPPVLNALTGRQLAAINPANLDAAQQTTIAAHIVTERAAGTATAIEFDNLLRVNPSVRNRWRGYVP